MAWGNVDLSKVIVATATFGGPIAMIRDEKKIVKLGTQSTKPILQIFTSSGIEMGAIVVSSESFPPLVLF